MICRKQCEKRTRLSSDFKHRRHVGMESSFSDDFAITLDEFLSPVPSVHSLIAEVSGVERPSAGHHSSNTNMLAVSVTVVNCQI